MTRYQAELYHYGVLGMKWGVRRYQNKDGTLTKAGKRRYNENSYSLKKNKDPFANRVTNDYMRFLGRLTKSEDAAQIERKINKMQTKELSDKQKSALNNYIKQHNSLVSDLSKTEIEYGRSLIKARKSYRLTALNEVDRIGNKAWQEEVEQQPYIYFFPI